MQEIKFRTLKAEEIECRPAMIKDGKATMLLYIDSRAVVRILNETVGQTNWCMEFEDVNGQLVGKMGIWDEDKGMFVYKSDTGSESNIEAAKGLISDCYKRCLSRWGVDELYSAPRIVVEDDKYGNSGYKVSKIEYNDNREIIELHIVNRFGKPVFDWPSEGKNKPTESVKEASNTPTTLERLKAFCSEKKGNTDKDRLLRFFNYYKNWKGNKIDFEEKWKTWS